MLVFFEDYADSVQLQVHKIKDFLGNQGDESQAALVVKNEWRFNYSLDEVLSSDILLPETKLVYLLFLNSKKDPSALEDLTRAYADFQSSFTPPNRPISSAQKGSADET